MRLTADEYRRGVLSWGTSASATARTSTTDDPDAERQWSAPLTEPAGSKVESPVAAFHHVRFESTVPGGLAGRFPVRWERLNPADVVQTEVWDRLDCQEAHFHLGYIPNYGTFHRLVVAATPYLSWGQDAVVRVGDARVHLVAGRIGGQLVLPFDEISVEGTTIALSRAPTADDEGAVVTLTGGPGGTVGTATLLGDTSPAVEREGRFVEVVAPGASPDDAEARAFAVLGLLALCWGDHAVGEVVFSNTYVASPGRPQEGVDRVLVRALVPRAVDDADLELVDRALTPVLGDVPLQRACALALRWYEKGVRATTSLDRFVSFFVAIEAILNAYEEEHGPIPAIRERAQRNKPQLRKLLQGQVEDAVYQGIMRSLTYVSSQDRMAFYAGREHLDATLVGQFKTLADTRADVLHSRTATVDDQRVVSARDLLVQMLKRALGIGAAVPWETLPQIGYVYRRYGFEGMGHPGLPGPADGPPDQESPGDEGR